MFDDHEDPGRGGVGLLGHEGHALAQHVTVATIDHLDERVDELMTRRQQLGRSPSLASDAVGLERDPFVT